MANRLSKVQRLVYVPAITAVTARPGYCEGGATEGSYSGFKFSGGSSSRAPSAPSVNYSGGIGSSLETTQGDSNALASNPPSGYQGVSFNGGFSPYVPTVIQGRVCYPAVAGVVGRPARLDMQDNFGWNASARSRQPLPDDGYARATLPASRLGVELGLTSRTHRAIPGQMSHSLVFSQSQFTVVEAGRLVFGPEPLFGLATVEIARAAGVVKYKVNGDLVYTSLSGSSGEAYLGALLYAVTDYVDSPLIAATAEPIVFSARLPAMVSAIGYDEAAFLVMPAPKLHAILDPILGVDRFYGQLPATVAAISDVEAVAWVKGALPAAGFNASLGPNEDVPDNFVGLLPPMLMPHLLLSGNSIEFSATLPVAFAAADIEDYCAVNAQIPLSLQCSIIEDYLPADLSDGSDAMVMPDWSGLQIAMLLVAMDQLDVSSAAEVVLVLELHGMDGLAIGDSTRLGSIIELLAMEQVSIMGHAGAARQQALQYAVNYLTGALTTYQDFDFIGFTQSEGRSFAWRKDGLYQLGTDDDQPVQALIDFGASDYGDSHLKRMSAAFVGVRTDGECYLRLSAADGVERTYRLIGGGDQKRATLAKGVTSRYWNIRLELTDASYATVDSIELEAGISQRRNFTRRG